MPHPDLSHNIRQSDGLGLGAAMPTDQDIIVEVEEGEDKPIIDSRGNILEIEYSDGSLAISTDGRPISEADDKTDLEDWFRNLAEDIDEGTLNTIADDLLRSIDEDLTSRKEWIEDRAEGLKLLGLKIEVPGLVGSSDGAPVEGMSRVRHPLLLEAVLRFQANARSELLPTDGPVKVRNDNSDSMTDTDNLADALESDMNHYLTAVAKEYYPDTDKMLFMLGFGGTSFKKVYFCPLRNRPVSESVDADDLIVNNMATDLSNARRITHRLSMRPSVVKRMQLIGAYRDVSLGDPMASTPDSAQQAKDDQQGISRNTMDADDRDREIYETYCELNIPGFEHKKKGRGGPTGLEIPYRVTIDVSSRQVLSLVRNYDEDTAELPEPRKAIVKYTFVPGLGFYDIGLLHILGNTTNALTATWRELLDAGMFASFPGFLIAKMGTRQNTNIFRVPPGGGAQVDTNGMPIQDAIMPLPYKEPSPALFQLAGAMTDTGMRIGGTSEQQVGEGRADAPVGTTLAMIDQATKVLNAVHKRLHTSQAAEFSLLAKCFREHPESFWQRLRRPANQWDEKTFIQALDNAELVPQADPNTASHTQRVMKVMGLLQLMQANSSLFDPIAVTKVAMQTLGWSNPEQFMAPIQSLGKPTPDMQKEEAELAVKKQIADARTKEVDIMGQKAQDESQYNQGQLQLKAADLQKPDAPTGLNPQDVAQQQTENQLKGQDLALKAQGIQQDHIETLLEAENRKRDRESKERIESMKFAADMATNPQGFGLANQIAPIDMIHDTEENEPPMPVDPGSVIQ